MKIFSVSQLNRAVNDYLEMGLGVVAVRGEVSEFRTTNQKLVFFTLKDKNASVTCFAMQWEVKQKLEEGQEIKLLAVPKLFQRSGGFHLRVREIELVGEGALMKAYLELKNKLEKEGLFREEVKKPLPTFPQRIGLITAKTGAAIKDVIARLNERWSGLEIFILPVTVQGLGAKGEIIQALNYFNQQHPVDVLILTRGGGSLEDYQPFNSEEVARAVFASRIPTIVGVGHEKDISLAELAADRRASTPTNAAEIVVPKKDEFLNELNYKIGYMVNQLNFQAQTYSSQIKNNLGKISLYLNDHTQKVSSTVNQLIKNFQNYFFNLRGRLEQKINLLNSYSPLKVLERGYTITFKNGQAVTRARLLKPADQIKTKFADGQVTSEVI